MADLHVVDVGSAARDATLLEWAGVRVAAGHVVETRYVPVEDVVIHAQQHPLSPPAVERAYCRQLELGDGQAWPPLTGYWRDDGKFVLTDGRHRFVAALMLGMEYVLVAWLVPPSEVCGRCAGTRFDGDGEPCRFCGVSSE
jgi:hypothetical protein